MKNLKLKKTIIALLLGVVFSLCAIPSNIGQLFANAAEPKDAYKNPATVDIKGTFDNNTSSTPENWTFSAEYESGEDKDSTSYGGVISAEILGWDEQFTDWVEDWIEDWGENHTFDDSLKESKKSDVKTALTEALKTTPNRQNSPLVPKFSLETTKDYKVLALMAGKTFTKYFNEADNSVALDSNDRTGYLKYTSNEFKLDQYSFYKISVWVKTTNDGKASISLNGDIDETAFESISTTATASDTTYYFYTFTDANNNTKTFISTTKFDAATIEYDGHKYIPSGTVGTFVPDTNDADYTDALAGCSISYNEKYEVANHTNWTEYTIYISTTTETSISLTLGLGNEEVKSSGNAFFDNVTVEKIQLLDFYNKAIKTETTAIYDNREIKNPNNADSRNYTVLQDFETSHEWSLINAPLDDTDLILVEEESATGFLETFPQSNPSGTNKILKVNNHGSKEVKIKTNTITLERNRYYRISLWAQTTQSSKAFTIELNATKANGSNGTIKDTTKPYVSGRNDDTSHVDNFWVNYIFYVKAPAEKNSEAYFNITLPSGSLVYFDNMVIENVPKKEFTDTKNNKLDLSTTIKDPIVTNGNFFDYDSVDIDKYSTPLPPSNWSNTTTADVYEYYNDATSEKFTKAYLEKDLTISEDKKTISFEGKDFVKAEDSDIYNYKDGNKIKERFILAEDIMFNYIASKKAYVNDTYDLEISTNIVAGVVNGNSTTNYLSISTNVQESTSYKSAIIDMKTSSSLYIISVDVYTDSTALINLKLVDSNKHVYSTIAGINTYDTTENESQWKTYKFYVGTGLETVKLQLVLEFDEGVGSAQFRNINGLNTTSLDVLTAKLAKTHEELVNDGIAVVNLAKETFIEHSSSINNTTHLYDTNLYKEVTIDGKTTGTYGILDTTNPHTNYTSITAKNAEASPYVLLIKNNAGESTKLEAMKKFTLAKSKYMTVKIVARAEGLSEGKAANITFTSLNTSFDITNSEFTEYILYIDNSASDKSATIDYVISLLDSAGTVIIDSISIESPENLDSAKKQYPDGDTDTVKFVVANANETSNETEEEKDTEPLEVEEEDKTLEIFLAIFSSLLLVAAIVFAIVYTRVKALRKPRKANEKNKVKETDDGQKGFV